MPFRPDPFSSHGVKAKNPAVAAWVQRQFDTIWRNYLPYLLRGQLYGWVGGEVTLRLSEYDLIEIDKLVPRYSGDIRLLKRDGDRSGIRIRRINGSAGELDLNFPYAYFHSFRPNEGEDYGNSILLGAYSAWADKWLTNGALDVQRLFMRKDAYRGMKIAYPSENMPVEGYDQPIPCRDVAMQIAEQAQSGGVMAYPSDLDINGNPKWRIEETHVSANPSHVMQYPKDCDDRMRHGMEIPDDVITSDGTGAWAGKRIPMAAFYSGLDSWVVNIFSDLRYTLDPLVEMNWGKGNDCELIHKPLATMAMEDQGNAGGQQQLASPPLGMFDQSRAASVSRMSLNVDREEQLLTAEEAVRAAKRVVRMSSAGDFDESKVKRDEEGQFSDKPQDSSGDRSSSLEKHAVQPTRDVKSLESARVAAQEFRNKDLVNKMTGLVARVTGNSLAKMTNIKAVSKSGSAETHAIAVANLDSLFKSAVHGWSKPDRKNDPNIEAIHRYFAPMKIGSRMVMTKLTIKETRSPDTPSPIYSVEAVDFNKNTPAAQWVAASAESDGIDLTSIRSAGVPSILTAWLEELK